MKKFLFLSLVAILLSSQCDQESMAGNVVLEDVDLNLVADGTYTGEYTDEKSGGMCKVEVTVANHIIEDIKVIDRKTTPIGKKGEYVITHVLKEQSLNVDAISGATSTSRITLKAIELALKKGIQPNESSKLQIL